MMRELGMILRGAKLPAPLADETTHDMPPLLDPFPAIGERVWFVNCPTQFGDAGAEIDIVESEIMGLPYIPTGLRAARVDVRVPNTPKEMYVLACLIGRSADAAANRAVAFVRFREAEERKRAAEVYCNWQAMQWRVTQLMAIAQRVSHVSSTPPQV